MRKHAWRSVEAPFYKPWRISVAQRLRRFLCFRAEPERQAVIFGQRAFQGDKLAHPLAQAGHTIFLRAADHDQATGFRSLDGLGDIQFVLPPMPAGKDERSGVAFSIRPRRDRHAHGA